MGQREKPPNSQKMPNNQRNPSTYSAQETGTEMNNSISKGRSKQPVTRYKILRGVKDKKVTHQSKRGCKQRTHKRIQESKRSSAHDQKDNPRFAIRIYRDGIGSRHGSPGTVPLIKKKTNLGVNRHASAPVAVPIATRTNLTKLTKWKQEKTSKGQKNTPAGGSRGKYPYVCWGGHRKGGRYEIYWSRKTF